MAKRVVILGGTGKMGRWFITFLKNKGFDVVIYSRFPEKASRVAEELKVGYISSIEAVKTADIVIVSTSLGSTAEMVRQVSKKMRSNSILFDVASVKGQVIESLNEAKSYGIRTISVHPMFGPGATSLKNKHVLVIPVGVDPEPLNEILHLFKDAEVHVLGSWEEHDKLVALTLLLPHFLNLIFGKILSKKDIRDLINLSGTTFALQLLVTETVYSEDPDLYYEIQTQNIYFREILDLLLESIKELAQDVITKDRVSFVKNFNNVRSSLQKDPNFTKAYSLFYKVYEAIS